MAVIPLDSPATATGATESPLYMAWAPCALRDVAVDPQQTTAPAVVSAHVSSPADTVLTPLVKPVTCTAIDDNSFAPHNPSPTCPYRLSPQHITPPPETTA